MCKRYLILGFSVVVAQSGGLAAAQFEPTAIYDIQIGTITFRGMGGVVGITTIHGPEESLIKANTTDLGGAAQSIDTGLDGFISWANFGGFPFGDLNAGDIIVPRTDPDLVTCSWIVDFGGCNPCAVETVNIPEPATGALAIVTAARRRRDGCV